MSPKQAEILGWNRQIPIRKDWEIVKVDIMKAAVFCKFKTHQKICKILLSTNNIELIENAPNDYF